MYTTLLAVPMLLADEAGWPSVRIGVILTTMAAASVIFAPLGGLPDTHDLSARYSSMFVIVISSSVISTVAGFGLQGRYSAR